MYNYGWVTQIDGKDYYRSITDPKDEVYVENGKVKKCKKKIKELKKESK